MNYQYVAAGLLAAFASGCADMRWHNDAADAATLERDLGECQQEARAKAVREASARGFASSPVSGVDVRGRAVLSQPGRVDIDRTLLLTEHDFELFCMRNRGYKLAPVEKPVMK